MSLIESLLVVIFTSPPLFPLLAHNAKRERKAEVIELQHGTRELPSWTAVVDKNPQKKRKRERDHLDKWLGIFPPLLPHSWPAHYSRLRIRLPASNGSDDSVSDSEQVSSFIVRNSDSPCHISIGARAEEGLFMASWHKIGLW